MLYMVSVGERICSERERKGLSKAELARRIGMTRAGIGQIESGETKSPNAENLSKIADVLGLHYKWLIFEKEPKYLDDEIAEFGGGREDQGVYAFTYQPDPTVDPRLQGKVPVISWVQAGDADLAIDLLAPGDAIDWKWCNEPHSDSTFALIVDGDSMTAPYGKSYPHKATIFVDPEKRGSVETGEAIIAKISGVDKVTFKSLARDDGRVFLKPLNPQYPNMFEEFRVLGKVIGKWED